MREGRERCLLSQGAVGEEEENSFSHKVVLEKIEWHGLEARRMLEIRVFVLCPLPDQGEG
jgi:hypothetical protein